jgi:Fe-S-cluster-containing dehydrogenase component
MRYEEKTPPMKTRREFLKNGALVCLASGGILACATKPSFPATGRARWGMVIDRSRCTGCQACMVACKLQSQTTPGEFNTRVASFENGAWPQGRIEFRVTQCLHCTDAPCVSACATGAAFTHPSGLVLTDWNRCDGNGACIPACPYDVRFHDPRFAHRVDKCDLCIDRLVQGLTPACVENCSPGARMIGRFDRPDGEFARYLEDLKRKGAPSLGRFAVIFHTIGKQEGQSS